MTHTLVELQQDAYLYFISTVDHPGWNKSAHFAQIDYGTGQGEESCLKIINPGQVWPALGNEIIGYLLAKACGIETPHKAAILHLDAGFLQAEMPDEYPPDAPREGELVAWCTTRLPNLATATWLKLHNDDLALHLTRSESGLKITALDTWLCNTDRNSRNVLRLPGGEFAAIDHELIFDGVHGDWRKGSIAPPAACSILDSITKLNKRARYPNDKYRQFLSAISEFANTHQRANAESRDKIDAIIAKIESSTAAKNVLSCLEIRADKDWMAKAIGLLL